MKIEAEPREAEQKKEARTSGHLNAFRPRRKSKSKGREMKNSQLSHAHFVQVLKTDSIWVARHTGILQADNA